MTHSSRQDSEEANGARTRLVGDSGAGARNNECGLGKKIGNRFARFGTEYSHVFRAVAVVNH